METFLAHRGYVDIHPIGQGGMGLVYKATDEKTGKEVAIKSFDPGLVEDRDLYSSRFQSEYELTTRCQHPNILKCYELLREESGAMHIVMEYLSGKSLSELIKEKSLSESEKLFILSEIASALIHVHAQGIVHRDLKPSNVMVSPELSSVKLVDFGIAATVTKLKEVAEEKLGSSPYMAPEQIRSALGSVDERSDIYSFGVLAFELFSGVLPFQDENAAALYFNHVVKEAPQLIEWYPELQYKKLSLIIDICLQKKKEYRYSNCERLKEKLDSLLSPSFVDRVASWLHRSATQ